MFKGDESALPVDEGDLLVDMNDFVGSVDRESLQVVVKELGADVRRHRPRAADAARQRLDVHREASAHTDETVAAAAQRADRAAHPARPEGEHPQLRQRPQHAHRGPARTATPTCARCSRDTPGAAREVRRLLKDLEPTLPVLLSDLVTVDQVVVELPAGLEQLLVTYPAMIAGGPTGSTADGCGHVNLQFDYSVPPCTNGYRPPERVAVAARHAPTRPSIPAECKSGAPYEMRGPRIRPGPTGANASPPRVYSGSYDPATGRVPGVVDANGNPVEFNQPDNLSVLGGDAWKWLLVGPVARR